MNYGGFHMIYLDLKGGRAVSAEGVDALKSFKS